MPSASTDLRKHGSHDQSSHGNWARGGSASNPVIAGSNVGRAVSALKDGKHVTLDGYKEAGYLVDELKNIVQEAIDKGEDAPSFDLCKATVKGSNLFCSQNKGIPRSAMPQLKAVPPPGSRAESLPADERGEVSLNALFAEKLRAEGVSIENMTVPAYDLKATQTELNGAKVSFIAQAYQDGKLADERLFVSKDGYIVDGHHRWASIVGVDLLDGVPADDGHTMKVAAIDMPIKDILAAANDFAGEWGLPQAGFNQGFAKKLLMLSIVEKHGDHDQSSHGNWARGGGRKPGKKQGIGVSAAMDLGGDTPEAKHTLAWKKRERYEGDPDAMAAATEYRESVGLPEPDFGIPLTEIPADLGRARKVAAMAILNFEKEPSAETRAAYDELVEQTQAQLRQMEKAGVSVEYLSAQEIKDRGLDPTGLNPYPTAEAQMRDVRDNKRLMIASLVDYPESYHPILDSSKGGAYDQFRAVHDYYGHVAAATGFDRHGEFQAWLHHTSMFTGKARLAASSELHVENSFLVTTGQSAPHFSYLLPDYMANPFNDDGTFKGDKWIDRGDVPIP